MHQEKYVFAQLVSFLDNFKFRRIVQKYDGDKYVKSFTCWNQLLVMVFVQFTDKSINEMLQILDRNLTHKKLLPELFDKTKINIFFESFWSKRTEFVKLLTISNF